MLGNGAAKHQLLTCASEEISPGLAKLITCLG